MSLVSSVWCQDPEETESCVGLRSASGTASVAPARPLDTLIGRGWSRDLDTGSWLALDSWGWQGCSELWAHGAIAQLCCHYSALTTTLHITPSTAAQHFYIYISIATSPRVSHQPDSQLPGTLFIKHRIQPENLYSKLSMQLIWNETLKQGPS